MSRDLGAADTWDPDQYNRYAAERELPFWDLAGLIAFTPHPRVVDLGCGDGRLTSALHRRLGASSTIGVDSSEAMIAAAAKHADDQVRFERGDIARWPHGSLRESVDVVFANASLQWVSDHATVLSAWTRALAPNGQLTLQMPANADHATHVVARELAAEWLYDPPADPVATNVLAPEEYAEILHDLGFAEQHVRLQVYAHVLASTDDAVEWVKGTSLTRFKPHMGEGEWERFLRIYRDRLVDRVGYRTPFFFPFKRILVWGRMA